MIVAVYGTTAELIKLSPVLARLTSAGVEWRAWCTAQHDRSSIEAVCDQVDLPHPHRWFVTSARATPLTSSMTTPVWAAACFGYLFQHFASLKRELRGGTTPPLILVHGDTLTTVVGSLMGRILGARVGHIEAGLRSGSIFSPFPEELDRRIVARLADLHFAPTHADADNLRRARGAVIVTGANTALDALRASLRRAPDPQGLPDHYCLLTLHRFELLRDTRAFTAIVRTMKWHSRHHPVVWVIGNTERAKLESTGLTDLFDDRFIARDKCAYVDFLPIAAAADYIVTDSGGLQEEAIYLGIPHAVHRTHTERNAQAAGRDYVLTGMRTEKLEAFLADPFRYRRPNQLEEHEPTARIVHALATLGYLGEGSHE